MGFSIERNGIIGADVMMRQIWADMIANGFTQKFPTPPGSLSTATNVTLEAGPTVDPLSETQPWRIAMKFTSTGIDINVATPYQLPDDGTIATASKGGLGKIGNIKNGKTEEQGSTLSGSDAIKTPAESYPLSYRLTITNRGIFCLWWVEGEDANGSAFSWFLVQRPVNPTTGETLVTGHAPVFCVYSTNGSGAYNPPGTPAQGKNVGLVDIADTINRFTVRERDVHRPVPAVPATLATVDYGPIMNAIQQVAIAENNQYILTFPNGLNTDRYAYKEELDMIAYTSADVISQYSEVEITVYGEATPRKYFALNANMPNNTGMRILALIQGSDIT